MLELMLVTALIGITSAMFATTFGAVVNRSNEVSDQNILQTEVRAALNTVVEDLRSSSYGDATPPIISGTNSSVSFFSPDRLAPNKLRRVKYFLQGSLLKRQVTMSTNSNGPPWSGLETDSGPIQTVIAEVQAPAIAAQPGYPNSGWAAGQVFKYCAQNPRDMQPLEESSAPDPITWTCTPPGSLDNIKSIVVRAAISATAKSHRYNFGSVATLRWNVEQ